MNYELVEATQQAEYCVIWMHGLGADGHDFVDLVPHLDFPKEKVRFVFPHADVMPVTINMGMQMRAWYDIKSLDANSLNRIVDVAGIENSIVRVNKLIDEQIQAGIKSENIVLAGFSQGGVIAIYTAITNDRKLAGLMALSTYLPAWDEFKQHITDTNKNLPIIVCHGTNDQVLPMMLGRDLSEKLVENGFENKFEEYQGMEHSLCLEEVKDISAFLKKAFKL